MYIGNEQPHKLRKQRHTGEKITSVQLQEPGGPWRALVHFRDSRYTTDLGAAFLLRSEMTAEEASHHHADVLIQQAVTDGKIPTKVEALRARALIYELDQVLPSTTEEPFRK